MKPAVTVIEPGPGPLLVFGGPYGNLQATQAVRDLSQRLGIAPGNVICTGDTAAYCAEPEACVALLREWGVHVVQGNCEQALAQDAEDCACGFEPGSACSVLSQQWYTYNKKALSQDAKKWMGALPEAIGFRWSGLRFRCVHASVSCNNDFVFASTESSQKENDLRISGADVILAGHCGLPFGQKTGAGYWLNAGVIGMPANDGQPRTWLMVLIPNEAGVEVHWQPLSYDFHSARAAMEAKGLANAYAEALVSGYWPSMDILPVQERRQAGRPFTPERLTIARPGLASGCSD